MVIKIEPSEKLSQNKQTNKQSLGNGNGNWESSRIPLAIWATTFMSRAVGTSSKTSGGHYLSSHVQSKQTVKMKGGWSTACLGMESMCQHTYSSPEAKAGRIIGNGTQGYFCPIISWPLSWLNTDFSEHTQQRISHLPDKFSKKKKTIVKEK